MRRDHRSKSDRPVVRSSTGGSLRSSSRMKVYEVIGMRAATPTSTGQALHGPQTQQGQRTLAAILTAAGELASLQGLEQLSMRALASASGMSKSGLYAHFSSKEELQLATVEHALAVFEEKVLSGPTGDLDPELGGLLARWLAFFELRIFPGGCFLIVAAVEFAHRPGPVRDALEKAIDREIAELATAIQRAKEKGELHADLDTSQTAFELHCVLMNAHALFQLKNDPAVFERARAAIHRLLAELDGP